MKRDLHSSLLRFPRKSATLIFTLPLESFASQGLRGEIFSGVDGNLSGKAVIPAFRPAGSFGYVLAFAISRFLSLILAIACLLRSLSLSVIVFLRPFANFPNSDAIFDVVDC